MSCGSFTEVFSAGPNQISVVDISLSFIAQSTDCETFYSRLPACWIQYAARNFLFALLPSAYYSGRAASGSSDDLTRLWTIASTKYDFMDRTAFIMTAKNSAFFCYCPGRN